MVYQEQLTLYCYSSIRIWNLEGVQTAHFVLHSPGMSVCWHPEETFKVIVYNLALIKLKRHIEI